MGLFFNTFIRIFAFLSSITIFIIILVFLIDFLSNDEDTKTFRYSSGESTSSNKIAIIKLDGPILNDLTISNIGFFDNLSIIYVNQLKKTFANLEKEKVKGIIISINSPGGSVSASFNLYKLIYEFKKKNNLTIFFHTNELIASGAYWAALSGDKIYADYGSLIGSIGVKGPDWIYFDEPIAISNNFGFFGNTVETRKGIKKFSSLAGNSKDLLDPFRPPSEKEIIQLQTIVNNIYIDFVNTVSKNRKLEKNFIIKDIGAMIYDTKEAQKNFLIDGVESFDQTKSMMIKYLNLKDYQIIKQNEDTNFFNALVQTYLTPINILESIKNSQIDEICNVAKYQFSSMMLQNTVKSKC